MDKVTGDELLFYIDQKSARECRISEEVDKEYEKEQEAAIKQRIEEEERNQIEESYINDIDEEPIDILNSTFDDGILNNTSLNRSGRSRSTRQKVDKGVQTDLKFDLPKIRVNTKICTDQVKSTCASVSTKCEMSIETVRLAVKTVMKGMYDHNVYLNVEEYEKAEGSSQEPAESEPPTKKKRTVPISKADYAKYQHILPSARTVNDFKHMQGVYIHKQCCSCSFFKTR